MTFLSDGKKMTEGMSKYLRAAKWIMSLLTLSLLLSGLYVPDGGIGMVSVYPNQKEACCVLDAPQSVDTDMDLCSEELLGIRETGWKKEQRERSCLAFSTAAESEKKGGNPEKNKVFSGSPASDLVLCNSDYDSLIQYIHNQDGSKG